MTRNSEIGPKLVLWWIIGVAAAIVIGFVAYQRYHGPQVQSNDAEHVAAVVRHKIATLWHPDAAMKFAHIQSLTLAPGQPGWYHGRIVYTFGEYEKKMSVSVLRQPDNTLQVSMNAPNNMPMRVQTVVTSQLFFEFPVNDEEAGKLAGWLVADGQIGKEQASMFLRRDREKVVYHFSIMDGVGMNAEIEAAAIDLAQRISAEVFAGEPVDVHVCDRKLKTLKVVSSQ